MKKILTLIIGSFALLSTVSAQEWNMSSASFSALGTLAATTTVEGLTIYASSDANVVVDANGKTWNGITFSSRLKLGGSGTFDGTSGAPVSRVLAFPVTGDASITIAAMSSSSTSDRSLTIRTADNVAIGTFPALGASIGGQTYSYTGGANTIYIFSPSSGVNVYYIKVSKPYLRDKQTMLSSGAFVLDGIYELFGPGSSDGYTNTQRQIASNSRDSLWCGLSNSLYSQWSLVLADTTNKVWNVKNHITGKYLSYNAVDSSLVISATPAGWQISLNATAPANNDYENVYTFWPAVNDQHGFYDFAIRVDGMIIEKTVASGTVTNTNYRICPMQSLTYGNINFYTQTSYVQIGARNTGEVFFQNPGDNKIYFTSNSASKTQAGSHWKVKRMENGRYTFQNRLTGQYVTYANDSTVLASATYTPGSDDQEWVVMFHCSKSGINYYTIQGRKLVLYGGPVNGGFVSVTRRNAGNTGTSSGGLARIRLFPTTVTYVAGEAKPIVTVPSVNSTTIRLNWTQNKEAAKYIVKMADHCLFSRGDSIGYDPFLDDTIYEQTPYIVDSICLKVDTVADLTYVQSGLAANVMHYFTVQAIDSTGLLGVVSDLGTQETVSLDRVKPAIPVLGTVTMKTLALSWPANDESSSYTITYWINPSDKKTITTSATNCLIEGILANTSVQATLTMHGGGLTSPASDPISTTTLPYTTVIMNYPEVVKVGYTAIVLRWAPAIDAVSYNVYITSDISKLNTVEPVNFVETTNSVVGLTMNTTYYIKVAAVDVAGVESTRSGTKIQKTTNLFVPLDELEDGQLGVISESGMMRIINAKDMLVTVYSITGKKVYSQMVSSSDEVLSTTFMQGAYMVRVNNQTIKALVK